jgi:hypothetical protein
MPLLYSISFYYVCFYSMTRFLLFYNFVVWGTHLILDTTSKHSFFIRQLNFLYFHGYDFASTNIFVAKSNGVTFKCFSAA